MGQSVSPPNYVGLCPGEHLHEFYMPLDEGESAICPECSCAMVIYAPEPEHARAERLRQTQKVMAWT